MSYGATTYGHDSNGNRVSETAAGVTKPYDHDARGTLRGATVGATAIRYVVDGEARRLARVENGTTTHDWLYRDGLQVAAELDGAGALRWRFVYAAGKHVPDGAIDAAGVAYRIVTDQVGSLRLVVRASDGVVVQRMRHDAWGRVEEDFLAAGVARVPFGFAGGIYDRGTGLVHFGAREYDPAVGRWVEKDPIGFEGGTTGQYEYGANVPGEAIDPSGTRAWRIPAPSCPGGSESSCGEWCKFRAADCIESATSRFGELLCLKRLDGCNSRCHSFCNPVPPPPPPLASYDAHATGGAGWGARSRGRARARRVAWASRAVAAASRDFPQRARRAVDPAHPIAG